MADQIPEQYRLDMYDFELPDSCIAQVPADRRDHSRLMFLHLDDGGLTDHVFSDIVNFLRPGDCLVLNDTRVFPARLFATKPSGGQVELLALEFSGDRFTAMYGTHRALKPLTRLQILDRHMAATDTFVIVETVHEGHVSCRLDNAPKEAGATGPTDAAAVFAAYGHMPLPPYIKRQDDAHDTLDLERYQTVYAENEGAVAAPTAGLHFTPSVLDGLRGKGVETVQITLHVGPGTFKPIRTEDVRLHDVGTEKYIISQAAADAINKALDEGRRVIAVGTTVVRTLESAGASGHITAGMNATNILITPGYQFKIIRGMLTNFHIPRSSLILLVSALTGRTRILDAYKQAVERGYRFYSYGDSMLIL